MQEAHITPTAAPMLFGRYRVTEQLGATRLAAVYAATDERLQRRVLVHLLRRELVGQERPHARFVAEAGQMARRSHPALLEVFDSGEANGRPFLVTEHCSGRPLYAIGALTVEQALLYVRQVAGAVAVCQARRGPDAPHGLYHPPISSSNVLVVDEGRVKLVDSWLLPVAEIPADLAHYRAPELSEGRPATPASAVYALGLLLYELLTGVRPVHEADARATALAHLSARIPPLGQVRPALFMPTAEQLLARATARLPEQRFPDAQAFGAALDTLWRAAGSETQRLASPAARMARPRPAAQAPQAPNSQHDAPQAAAPSPAPRSARQQPVNAARLRRQGLVRNLVGWLVMMALLLAVALASYLAVTAIADRLAGRLPAPRVPGLPSLPEGSADGPLGWLDQLLGRDEIYIVNIAEGLNLRSAADVEAQILAVVPNGTPVRRLEGPVVEDNIPWLRVRAEVGGEPIEGWMSLNYLRLEE